VPQNTETTDLQNRTKKRAKRLISSARKVVYFYLTVFVHVSVRKIA